MWVKSIGNTVYEGYFRYFVKYIKKKISIRFRLDIFKHFQIEVRNTENSFRCWMPPGSFACSIIRRLFTGEPFIWAFPAFGSLNLIVIASVLNVNRLIFRRGVSKDGPCQGRLSSLRFALSQGFFLRISCWYWNGSLMKSYPDF